MNLHSIVNGIITAVNPNVLVGIRISVGNVTGDDGVRVPTYATPGSFMGTIAGDQLTVFTVGSGVLQVGQTLGDEAGNVDPGTEITVLGTGDGGIGTYTVSVEKDVAPQLFTTALVLPAQVQALSGRDLRQAEGLNLQGDVRALYINGSLDGVVRPLLKGGDLVTLPDGTVWLVSTTSEPWNLSAGWTKAIITLQNGS